MLRDLTAQLVVVRAIALLILCILNDQQAAGTPFGINKSPEGCQADHAAYDEMRLSGDLEPVLFTGPPSNCDTEGCLDVFWAPLSRYELEPTCPKHLVKELTDWLRQLHGEGSWWAGRVLTLLPCDLWQVVRNRTTWVIGDSVVEGFGHALTQLLLEYWDKKHWNKGLTNDPALAEAVGYGATENARALGRRAAHWCFEMGNLEESGRICYIKGDVAKRLLYVIPLMKKLADPNDVILLGMGLHYNDMEDLGEDMLLIGDALSQPGLPKNTIWMETLPQHYDSGNGMYNESKPTHEQFCQSSGDVFGTKLVTFANGTLGIEPGAKHSGTDMKTHPDLHRLIAGGERNLVSQPIIDSCGIKTLRTWNLTLPMSPELHKHVHQKLDFPHDCTHVCSPSSLQLVLMHFLELLKNSDAS